MTVPREACGCAGEAGPADRRHGRRLLLEDR